MDIDASHHITSYVAFHGFRETYNFGIFPSPADTEVFNHDGKERNIVQDGGYPSLVVIGFEKVAILALDPFDVLGR